ncbi:MAG: hypothetical protein EAZ13_04605 [Sphingobacteriia bacterium]|jgi:hypothetical protein|nr:MAG: hypothetical protein EAZ41_04510 [Sphingobacteriia bacterium]TAG31481.1 MAG: hypothetical protein EAZ35_03415 [Sphingobacteriia bacterium]TAH08044.1 MAG: hypothetical protein EAZ13_04605 [Sphingobacteriia bacterium]
MKNFKEEELIMYVYKDCTPELTAAISKAIEEDAELKHRINIIERSIEQLNLLQLKSPSKQSIKAILEYAKLSKK